MFIYDSKNSCAYCDYWIYDYAIPIDYQRLGIGRSCYMRRVLQDSRSTRLLYTDCMYPTGWLPASTNNPHITTGLPDRVLAQHPSDQHQTSWSIRNQVQHMITKYGDACRNGGAYKPTTLLRNWSLFYICGQLRKRMDLDDFLIRIYRVLRISFSLHPLLSTRRCRGEENRGSVIPYPHLLRNPPSHHPPRLLNPLSSFVAVFMPDCLPEVSELPSFY